MKFERYTDPHESLLHKLEAGVQRDPKFGPVILDSKNFKAKIDEQELKLTKAEFQILWMLVRAQGGYVNEEEILNFLHEQDDENKDLPLSNVTQVQISRLRTKIEHVSKGEVTISVVLKHGYCLDIQDKHILEGDR